MAVADGKSICTSKNGKDETKGKDCFHSVILASSGFGKQVQSARLGGSAV
jgi:hypothetical protein